MLDPGNQRRPPCNRDRLRQERVTAQRDAATRALFPERQKEQAQERDLSPGALAKGEPPTRAFNR